MKCPYCKSTNVQGTNVGTRVVAGVCGTIAGFLSAPITGTPIPGYKGIFKEICPYRKYICLSCKEEFSENAC